MTQKRTDKKQMNLENGKEDNEKPLEKPLRNKSTLKLKITPFTVILFTFFLPLSLLLPLSNQWEQLFASMLQILLIISSSLSKKDPDSQSEPDSESETSEW